MMMMLNVHLRPTNQTLRIYQQTNFRPQRENFSEFRKCLSSNSFAINLKRNLQSQRLYRYLDSEFRFHFISFHFAQCAHSENRLNSLSFISISHTTKLHLSHGHEAFSCFFFAARPERR